MNLYEELSKHHTRSKFNLNDIVEKWKSISEMREPCVSLGTVVIEPAIAAAILVQFGEITGDIPPDKAQDFVDTAIMFRDALARKCNPEKVKANLVFAVKNSRIIDRVEVPPVRSPAISDLDLATMIEMAAEPDVQF